MNITEERLRANGWEQDSVGMNIPVYWKGVRADDTNFEVMALFHPGGEVEISLSFKRPYPLPNIRTMEQLALLFALLGDKTTIDDLTIPPALRADAGAIERAVGKEFGDVS